jgi:tRNA G18 (ribose-2'-O)-methylase SpoU
MRGYFGIGVYHPKTEENIGTLWREANLFGADFIFTIGKRYHHQASDTMRSPNHIPLFEFTTISEFIKAMPKNAKKICIEITDKAQMLNTFVHPQRAIYILGAEDYGLPQKLIDQCDVTIEIPQATDICSSNVAVSGSIVVYDRYVKSL